MAVEMKVPLGTATSFDGVHQTKTSSHTNATIDAKRS